MWKVKKSKMHGSGLFASENITKGTKIIEYIGEKVSKAEGDRRSEKRIRRYLKSKETGSVYIFELNKKYDIDGSPKYNKAINYNFSPVDRSKIVSISSFFIVSSFVLIFFSNFTTSAGLYCIL